MLWLSDTYVSTWTGFIYVAFVIAEVIQRRGPWRSFEAVGLIPLMIFDRSKKALQFVSTADLSSVQLVPVSTSNDIAQRVERLAN